MLLSLYRGLTWIGGPAIDCYLVRRRAAGKEDPLRHPERRGIAVRPRPAGKLVWIHAASVGESLSVLALIDRLLGLDEGLHVLVTTGTVTSAALMAERLPARALHQYVPVDRGPFVRRFLDHWRPDLALWVESEIWPNLLGELGSRGVPAALVNARLSERSFRRWRRAPGLIRSLLAPFRLALAQNQAIAERLRQLGVSDVRCVGNLKYSAEPLPADPERLAALTAAIGARPLWLLASSHEGEEAIAADAHRRLAASLPGLLTIIAPRHPARGAEIETQLAGTGLAVARRDAGALPGRDTEIYLADTMGELGLLFRLAPVVCVGGSLVPWGGHNPIEPALLGACVLFGPHMENFQDIADALCTAGGAVRVADGAELAAEAARLLSDPATRSRIAAAGRAAAERNAHAADDAVAALRPLLREAGIGADR